VSLRSLYNPTQVGGLVAPGFSSAFTYDALGDRVQWVSPSGTSEYYADISGNLLGVSGSYSIVMQGIRPLAVYTSAETWFHHVNDIGSRTFMANHYGTPTQDMVFYPFGGLWLNWGGGGLEFANLNYYDTNLNTDITEYRVMSNNLGRWHSPDPLGGDISNPQSLNRYAYVLNNPVNLTDHLGRKGVRYPFLPESHGPQGTAPVDGQA